MSNLDLHMKDIELLLRCFAMAYEYRNYKPSLANFLNTFSKKAKEFDIQTIAFLEKEFVAFLEAIKDLDLELFISEKSRRFNIFLFESIFACIASKAIKKEVNSQYFIASENRPLLDNEKIKSILTDTEFQAASVAGTTNTTNVFKRFDVVEKYLSLRGV